MTKLSVAFAHTVQASYRKGAAVRRMQVVSRFDVEVPDVSGADVPLSFRARATESGSFESRTETATLDYRFDQGRLLKPLPCGDSASLGCFHSRVTAKDGQARIDDWVAKATILNKGGVWNVFSKAGGGVRNARVESELPEPIDLVFSDRETCEEKARAEWKEAVFVDGILHVASNGPALVTVFNWDTSKRRITAGIQLRPEIGWLMANRSRITFFSPADMEGAMVVARKQLAAARASAARQNHTYGVADDESVELEFTAEIGSLATLAVRDSAAELTGAVAKTLWNTRQIVGELPPSGIRAYAMLKMAAERKANLDELVPLAEALSQEGLTWGRREKAVFFKALSVAVEAYRNVNDAAPDAGGMKP